jgi:hypothetical protein
VPTANRDSFQASSKAHVQSQPHKLGVYVIGLKIEGVPRAQLLSNISEVTAQSDRSETPQVQLTLPPGRLLLGGYVFSQWVQGATSGQLLEGSWGTTSGGYWKAKTRDHIDIDSLKITVSLAHIPSSIGGVQLQSVELGAAVASPSGIGQAIVDFKFAALTGIGAWAEHGYEGRGLTQIGPLNHTFRDYRLVVTSKDHLQSDAGTTWINAIGLQEKLPGITRCQAPAQ